MTQRLWSGFIVLAILGLSITATQPYWLPRSTVRAMPRVLASSDDLRTEVGQRYMNGPTVHWKHFMLKR